MSENPIIILPTISQNRTTAHNNLGISRTHNLWRYDTGRTKTSSKHSRKVWTETVPGGLFRLITNRVRFSWFGHLLVNVFLDIGFSLIPQIRYISIYCS